MLAYCLELAPEGLVANKCLFMLIVINNVFFTLVSPSTSHVVAVCGEQREWHDVDIPSTPLAPHKILFCFLFVNVYKYLYLLVVTVLLCVYAHCIKAFSGFYYDRFDV